MTCIITGETSCRIYFHKYYFLKFYPTGLTYNIFKIRSSLHKKISTLFLVGNVYLSVYYNNTNVLSTFNEKRFSILNLYRIVKVK